MKKKNEKNDPNRRSSGGDPIRGCLEYPHRIPLSGVSVFTRRALPCRVQQRKTFQLTPPPPIIMHRVARDVSTAASPRFQETTSSARLAAHSLRRRRETASLSSSGRGSSRTLASMGG
jgi:hypothetical protein